MKPLVVLLGAFFLCLLITRLFFPAADYLLCGRFALCAMLLFTASGHFAFTRGMEMMMPAPIPFKKALVYFTGLAEIAGGIGLLIPSWQRPAAVLLLVFFVLVLPVNINAALKRIDYQKAATGGPGPGYLWFRVPLQGLFIAWTWWVALR